MNNVSIVGMVEKAWDATNERARMKHACCFLGVQRPYRVNGEYKYDTFLMKGWGPAAERLLMTKPGQIIGVTGALEIDDDKNAFVNVRSIFFYSNKETEVFIGNLTNPEAVAAGSGFESIPSSDIPDF